MTEHAPGFRDHLRPHLRAIVGVLLSLVLIGLVAARATGAFGETTPSAEPDSVAAPAATDSASPTALATPPVVEPAATMEPRKERPRERPKRKPDGSLVGEVEDLLDVGTEEPARFRVSSFNVLGASHTSGRGDRPGKASGTTRMGWAVQLLRAYNVDVVGFQEFEVTQYHNFMARTGGAFGVYPGPRLGRNPTRNSIAWRQDTWELVSAHTIAIPYFHGNRVPMPYVLLEHRDSGRQVYFFNIHNPASTSRWGNNERWRDLATNLEIGLVNRLHRETGLPVVMTGDFNERDEAFCRITAGAQVRAANGGSTGGSCVRPANMGIDWIFGSESVTFSNYLRNQGPLVRRASDHPMILADAQLGEE